jgi:hypothetical protein
MFTVDPADFRLPELYFDNAKDVFVDSSYIDSDYLSSEGWLLFFHFCFIVISWFLTN